MVDDVVAEDDALAVVEPEEFAGAELAAACDDGSGAGVFEEEEVLEAEDGEAVRA